jgi:hypothetical protein
MTELLTYGLQSLSLPIWIYMTMTSVDIWRINILQHFRFKEWRKYIKCNTLRLSWWWMKITIFWNPSELWYLSTRLYRIISQKTVTAKSNPCNRPRRPRGLWDVKAPTFSRQSAHRWQWGCQLYAPAALYPQEVPGTDFCWRLIQPQGWKD